MASESKSLAVFPQGDEVMIEVGNRDARGGLSYRHPAALWPFFDPSGGMTITVLKPNGTQLTGGPMTRFEEGKYRFTFTLAEDATPGVYTYRAVARHGVTQRGMTAGAFKVIAQ